MLKFGVLFIYLNINLNRNEIQELKNSLKKSE